MKITMEGTHFLSNKTGIGIYVYNIFKYIIEQDNINKYSVFYNVVFPDNYELLDISKNENVINKFCRIPRRFLTWLWNKKNIPAEITVGNTDIFVSTGIHIPEKFRFKLVSFVYDVNVDGYPDREKKYLKNKFYKIINKSDLIIATSNQTKLDLINNYKAVPDKIKVIYGALPYYYETINFSDDTNKKTIEKYKLPDKYYLFVGTIEYRKNLKYILDAVYSTGCNLVIVGKPGDSYNEIKEYILEKKLTDKVVFTGYVDDAELPCLYKNSTALIYTSRYEGFGLPVLEAYKFDTPVITSKKGSIPELAGDAGLYVENIENSKELSCIIQNIEDNGIDMNEIKQKMKIQLSKFSWEFAAKKFIKSIKSI